LEGTIPTKIEALTAKENYKISKDMPWGFRKICSTMSVTYPRDGLHIDGVF